MAWLTDKRHLALFVFTIANLWHATNRIWTCAEPEFRFRWMKLCSKDNHYTTVPLIKLFFCMTKKSWQKIKILKMKRTFKVKKIFTIVTGLCLLKWLFLRFLLFLLKSCIMFVRQSAPLFLRYPPLYPTCPPPLPLFQIFVSQPFFHSTPFEDILYRSPHPNLWKSIH